MKPTKRDILEKLERMDRKLDTLLRRTNVDLSKEDAQIRQTTDEIADATHRIPTEEEK